MKFIKIEKKDAGKFINRYDIHYELDNGEEKIYEIVSRSGNLEKKEDLSGEPVAAVVLIMHSADGERVLLNREFRMACGAYVYNLPAGIIEPGEDLLEAAKRELYEETGMHIDRIDDILGESFGAMGFSNEKNKCVVGVASGGITTEHAEDSEEIEPGWYTKEEAAALIRTELFSARAQAYCYVWSRS